MYPPPIIFFFFFEGLGLGVAITIDNVEYYYKQGLINSGVLHSVQNGNEPRLILKITVYDKTFEEVAENLKWRKKEQSV